MDVTAEDARAAHRAREAFRADPANMFEHIEERFESPATVIDVGVANGTPGLYARFPDAYLLLVDPLEEWEHKMQRIIRNRPGSYVVCALGSEDSVESIHIQQDAQTGRPLLSKSSISARTPNNWQMETTVTRRPVEIRRLDDVIAEVNPPAPFFLKIDTEGHELEVLRGATETLRSCTGVVAEVSVAKRFEGSSSFAEFIAFMDEHGFTLSRILHNSFNHADLFFEPKGAY